MIPDTQNRPIASRLTALHFLLTCFCLALLAKQTVHAGDLDLRPSAHTGVGLRVKTVIEVAGSLHVTTADKQTRTQPTEVKAELFYDQIGLAGELTPAVRHYWDAKADFQFGEDKQQRTLREDRQLIVLADDDSANRFWSPHGMLQRDELDLLDVVGSAFPPERLLPLDPVDASETWPLEKNTAAQLLRLDKVTSCDVTNTITDTSDDTIKVKLEGTVEGEALGATTKIEVQGKYHFDRKTKIISWLALGLREKREKGFAAPGFEVTVRIRSARQWIDESDALPPELIAQIQPQPSAGEQLLEFISEGDLRYRAALDRRWHLVHQRQSSARLRFVDDGDLVTTCKIDRLNRLPADRQVTLTGFQADVRAALDENCKEIVSAGESVNPQGLRVLRVVAAGEVSQTPIRWIYYHLSDDQGQRLSLVFTHEAAMESRLQGVDESLTSSITLLPRDVLEDQQAKRDSDARF